MSNLDVSLAQFLLHRGLLNATATRNGVVIVPQSGERVFKNDVVATGANSACSISFIDGSAFNLSADCRMVLNEMARGAALQLLSIS